MARWDGAWVVAIGLGVGLLIAATALVPLSHALTGSYSPFVPDKSGEQTTTRGYKTGATDGVHAITPGQSAERGATAALRTTHSPGFIHGQVGRECIDSGEAMEHQGTTLEQEPWMVFAPAALQRPGLELCVNFGLCTGREATPAEIELLGQELLVKIGRVTIVSERRYEIGADAKATVHQLRVQLEPAALES